MEVDEYHAYSHINVRVCIWAFVQVKAHSLQMWKHYMNILKQRTDFKKVKST